jgi:polyisoprenoid-binding protein YceI
VNIDQTAGTLTLLTGVTGPAARMGHRLTIAMESWRLRVEWADDQPVSADLVIDVDSLRVLSGEGGVTSLSGPEKQIVRGNALKTLDAKHFPTIEYHATNFAANGSTYRVSGDLTLHGTTGPVEVDVEVVTDVVTDASDGAAEVHLATQTEVSHKAFGLRPFSMAMGAMKVADIVTVQFSAKAPWPDGSRVRA